MFDKKSTSKLLLISVFLLTLICFICPVDVKADATGKHKGYSRREKWKPIR